jgi:hypothetical protein
MTMTVPKWLIPVLAAVAAIAVGVAAALFAVRFAEPETVLVAPELIEVPVLAPVADDIPLEEVVAAAGDEIPVSPTVTTEEVVDPDSVPEGAVPEELAALLDDLETADDPADVMPSPGAPASDTPTGDPCADAPGDDCPEGAPGTIRALGGELPALTVWSTGANNAACPAPDEAGSLRFWARVNAPVTFNLRISQGDARSQVVETTDEQIDQWLEDSASGEEAWIEYCIEIVDLIPDVLAIVYLDATDELDRRATRSLSFAVGDTLTIPPTRIHPIGDSLVFVSAPHRADNALRMYVIAGDRETQPTCSYDGLSRLRYLTTVRAPHTEEVSAEYLETHDYEPAYTRRTSATFAVPANTPLIVCVGWFPATDTRPTFDQDTPMRVSEYRMTSPDVVAPVVTVAELVLTEAVADGGIRLRGSTENGQLCGWWSAPPFTAGGSNVVCDFGALLGYTDAGGSLLVTTEVDTPEGLAVNNVLLDVSLLSCVDGCSGRTRSFDVELSKFIRPSRICSEDCRINVGETAGIARLRATWPASTAGTGAGWVLGDWREGSAVLSRDPLPELDTRSEFSVVPSGDPADRTFRATAAIRVDRPVTVVAELISRAGIPDLCPRPGGTSRWESTTRSTLHTITFEGLCFGTAHAVSVTLTAADGATRTYAYESPTDATSAFWLGAGFSTPAQTLPVVVNDLRISTGDPERVVALESLRVIIGGVDARMLSGHPEQRCWVGDVNGLRSGLSDASVGETVTIQVTARLRDATEPANPDTSRFPTRCREGFSYADVEVLEFRGYVSYDDFIAGPTVTITDPDTGYSVQMRLTDEIEG